MIPMHRFPATRLRAAAVAATAAPLLLAGCGGGLPGDDPGTGPRVVASFYPLAYVAERVAGEHAEVVNLTSPGVEPHDLELSVQQTAEIAEGDLVVYEKGMQPAVDEAVAQHGPEQVVEATEVVNLAPLTEHTDEAHAENEGHAEDEAAQGEAHADHGDEDLHFWTDPARMIDLAAEVRDRMAEVDPDHADAYRADFKDLKADLEDLEQAYEDGLADCGVDTVVVSHDAFGYLGKYGLHFEPIAGLSPDAEPSAAHLAELSDLIRDEGVTTVFSETLASPAMAETLARDLGVETAVLDPIEGLSDETADEDYLSLMRSNLAALEEAQRCR
jgi:zinc transport system substrate-binding protein